VAPDFILLVRDLAKACCAACSKPLEDALMHPASLGRLHRRYPRAPHRLSLCGTARQGVAISAVALILVGSYLCRNWSRGGHRAPSSSRHDPGPMPLEEYPPKRSRAREAARGLSEARRVDLARVA